MTDPDKNKLTELDLEMEQRQRLMNMYSLVETYDGREAVIAFCDNIVKGQRKD